MFDKNFIQAIVLITWKIQIVAQIEISIPS